MSPERQQTVCACEASIALGVTPLSPFCLPSHRAELGRRCWWEAQGDPAVSTHSARLGLEAVICLAYLPGQCPGCRFLVFPHVCSLPVLGHLTCFLTVNTSASDNREEGSELKQKGLKKNVSEWSL